MSGGFAGKIVVDITNPMTADFSGLSIGHTTSAAEEIQKRVPAARVVKAFNTIFAQVLQNGGEAAGRSATDSRTDPISGAPAKGRSIVPLCPFAKAQFSRHPECQDALKR